MVQSIITLSPENKIEQCLPSPIHILSVTTPSAFEGLSEAEVSRLEKRIRR